MREGYAFTEARVSQPRNFCHFTSGVISGIYYDSFFARDGLAVASLLIGLKDSRENQRLFDWLKQDQAGIEIEFGGRLSWSQSNGVRFSIGISRPGSIEDDAANLQVIHEWFVVNLLKLKEVFDPRLRAYKDAR